MKVLSPLNFYQKFQNKTPTFLFERRILIERIKRLKGASEKRKARIFHFYPLKANFYSGILETVLNFGFGLEVASLREMKLAKEAGAKKIVFNGPAKTKKEIDFVIKNFDEVLINLDSFEELNLIKKLKSGLKIGIRVWTPSLKSWARFGIPLLSLKKFLSLANKKGIKISAIHFHSSWNKESKIYLRALKEIKDYFLKNLEEKEIESFEIFDIGGGLLIEEEGGEKIEKFFDRIENFWEREMKPIFPKIKIFTEFGRWLVSHCFHIFLKVVEKKNENLVVLDGGTDNFGFSQKNNPFAPLNISNFSKKKMKIKLVGSLCSIYDVWANEIFAKKIEKGDLILFPFQGAYNFNLKTEFIRDSARVIEI